VDNPVSPMKFLATAIRTQVRSDFERFIKVSALKTAQAQAEATISGLFQ
jgi:hypothetical protein